MDGGQTFLSMFSKFSEHSITETDSVYATSCKKIATSSHCKPKTSAPSRLKRKAVGKTLKKQSPQISSKWLLSKIKEEIEHFLNKADSEYATKSESYNIPQNNIATLLKKDVVENTLKKKSPQKTSKYFLFEENEETKLSRQRSKSYGARKINRRKLKTSNEILEFLQVRFDYVKKLWDKIEDLYTFMNDVDYDVELYSNADIQTTISDVFQTWDSVLTLLCEASEEIWKILKPNRKKFKTADIKTYIHCLSLLLIKLFYLSMIGLDILTKSGEFHENSKFFSSVCVFPEQAQEIMIGLNDELDYLADCYHVID